MTGTARDYGYVNRWSGDVPQRLMEYTARGKMIRGALVVLGSELFGVARSETTVQVASAMELIQSFLLAHDDIMDRDEVRRGGPSLHRQYAVLASTENMTDSAHFGESMGICVGDIAYSIAFEMLAALEADVSLVRRLLILFSREITSVGLAQMEDIYNGSSPHAVTADEVVHLYRYKTGRYTFSLPLEAGAMLAGQPQHVLDAMSNLGEHLGIIFQVKDDELGLFGSQDAIGKPVGSDIQENKKTIFRQLLFERAPTQTRERLSARFGKKAVTEKDVEFVRAQVEELGVRREIDEIVQTHVTRAREIIDRLDVTSTAHRSLLLELLQYNLQRTG